MVRHGARARRALVLLQLGVLTATAGAAGVFSVLDFGAVGDGVTDDTAAVREAVTAVGRAHGGTLLFPSRAGGSATTYLTGAFNVSSNTHVEIAEGATVLGSTDGEAWPLVSAYALLPQFGPVFGEGYQMHQAMVFSWNARNVSFGGGGTVDCNANFDTWWKCADNLNLAPCNGHARGFCFFLFNVTGVVMEDLHVQNSPGWTLHFNNVTNLRVRRVNVTNPQHAPNTDGIDVSSCQDVIVEDSSFSTGDDALCVKSGKDYFGRLWHMPSRDIIFRRIRIGTGHGISVGSEMSGDIANVTFEDIDMRRTGCGVRIKSQRGRGGVVSDVVYRNITMSDILSECIQVTSHYHELEPTNATATPVFQNILLENVHCDSAKNSFRLQGLPEQKIVGLELRNVTFAESVGPEAVCADSECTCDPVTNRCPSCCHPAARGALEDARQALLI